MREGRLGYNSNNGRYGLLSSDLWIDTGFHCGEGLEVLVDDQWVKTRMEMNPAGMVTSVGFSALGKTFYAFEGNIHCTGAPIALSILLKKKRNLI